MATGAAWSVPGLVIAAAAPAAAASCTGPLRLLYGDFGTVTNPIVTYTGSKSTACTTISGTLYLSLTFVLTIKNTSATQTISNLAVPMPYLALANSSSGCTTPGTQTANGVWTVPIGGFAGGPTSGRDAAELPGTLGSLSFQPFTTYSSLIPSSVVGPSANGGFSICAGTPASAPVTTPVYTPPQTTLAPGASTIFNLIARVEATSCPSTNYQIYTPDFIVGRVC